MEKNIKNVVFLINNLIHEKKVRSSFDTILDSIVEFINSTNDSHKKTNIFFLVDKIDLSKSKQMISTDETIKTYLKNQKIKLRNNNIHFICKKDDDQIDVDSSLIDIVAECDAKKVIGLFSKDDTIIIYTDVNIGQIMYMNGFYSLFVYCSDNDESAKYSRDLEGLSNQVIDLLNQKLDLDSLSYDFISFLESNN